MLAPAPVMFSTITGWPSDTRMRSERMRANVSVGPPAGNGTMRVTGRDGKVSACANTMLPRAAAMATARCDSFMHSLLVSSDDDTRAVGAKSQQYCHTDVNSASLPEHHR